MTSLAIDRSKPFINYPEPLKGPDVPYKNERKSNPAITGPILRVCVFLMEWVRFIREMVWHNAGFGDLRKIRFLLEDYEPMCEATIIPKPEEEDPSAASPEPEDSAATASQQAEAAAAAAQPPAPSVGKPKYPTKKYYSVADYRALYLSGEVTPLDVAQALLPLIRRDVTPRGPHSVAFFDSKADLVLRAAEASTRRYREGKSLGPLDGVPTAVKDEYDIEGYATCLGSRNDYTGKIPGDDGTITSWCVRRLEAAGCVVLGKLSMVEFGLDTPGTNLWYGTPPNPYNPRYYPGGSSSGSAYAVSAGLIPFALGSDGGGSIRIPSSFCGVFGIKPTAGRISFSPGQNHCLSCASLGPIAADVRSLAAVLEVVSAPHPSSPFPPLARAARILASPSPPGGPDLHPRLLGVVEPWFARAEPAVSALCRSMITRLVAQRGYRVVPVDIPFLAEGQTAHALTVLNDAATLLPDPTPFSPANRILLAIGSVTPATDYLLAQKLRRALVQHLAHLWTAHPGMLLVTPATSCAGWPMRDPAAEAKWGVSDGDRTLMTMEYCWLANFCGLPSLTAPAGYAVPVGEPGAGEVAGRTTPGKVPVGLMATGEWASEAELLRFGLDAEDVGRDVADRPPIWVDTVALAKEVRKENGTV
ncbi:Amidotransferase [Pleurostoma richardsiae]|uniref:Amidotransferase n=1 Tax=Pleurostoma richardsiae TaxID=41990 RepID=A0AA38RHI1_9PEZI|nr:Amidotransferase [Pleurostoma richardsiae]